MSIKGYDTPHHFSHEWRPDYRSLIRVLSFVRPHMAYMVVGLLCIIGTVLTVLWLGYGLRQIIDKGFYSYDHLKYSVIVLASFILSLAVFSYGRLYFASVLGEKVSLTIRHALLRKLLSIDVLFYERRLIGELLSTLIHDVWLVQTLISQSIPTMLRNLLIAMGGTIFLFYNNVKLALIMCCIFPIIVLPLILFGDWARTYSKRRRTGIASATSIVEEALLAIKTVQAFNKESLEEEKILLELRKGVTRAKRHIRIRASIAFGIIFLGFGVIGFILWVGGSDVLNHKITSGQLTSFIFYSLAVVGSLGTIGEMWGDVQRAASGSSRIKDILDEPCPLTALEAPKADPHKEIGSFIAFRNVTFCYPTQPGMPVLKNVSFDVPHGKTVAFIGPSGAGKTTIFELLMRFYDPQEGAIYLGGVDIRSLPLDNVRRQMALVSQESMVLSGSIKDNIAYGCQKACSSAQIKQAATMAMVTEFSNRLPHKLDTEVGARGAALSSGQRQRIAIARAFLRDAPILLLDEATSALDAQQEALVQKAVEQLMAKRTTLIIAHRLSTVTKANLIIVLHNGGIAASGTHQQLLKKSSIYRTLAQLQFLDIDPI